MNREMFDSFPFTTLRGKNRGLDWVMQKVKEFSKVIDALPEAVNTAVNEAIKNGVDFEVATDTTLTLENIPADSKAVGDRFAGLTAADVKARPVTWTPTAADVGARSNTWLPGLDEIGAVSRGSVSLANTSVKAWAESVTGSAWAYTNRDTADMPAEIASADNYALATVTTVANGGWKVLRLLYVVARCEAVCVYNYGWGDWEWVNPPLIPSAEYRTCERFNKSPVYVKLIKHDLAESVGNGDGLTDLSISHGISNFSKLVRETTVKSGYTFPLVDASGGISSIAAVSDTSIFLRIFKSTLAAGSIYITLYYTKTV